MTRRVQSVSATVLGLVLIGAACGGGGTKVNSAADLALAQGAVLTQSDVPAGFTGTPHTDSGDPPEQTKRDFANCLHTDFTFFDETKGAQKANGPDFKNSDTDAEIDNSIEIDPSKSTVDKGYKLFQNSSMEECLGKLFDTVIKQAQQGDTSGSTATFGASTVGRFAVDGIGDRGLGFRIVTPVTTGEGSTNAYIDFLLAQRGRAIIQLSSQTFDTEPDRNQELQLMKLMSDRLGQKAP
jgi:hypothetical protein